MSRLRLLWWLAKGLSLRALGWVRRQLPIIACLLALAAVAFVVLRRAGVLR